MTDKNVGGGRKELHDECGGFDESLTFGEDTDYIERLAKQDRFKVLRSAKIGVSTRRLEEEGITTLIKQYGKSTLNDYLGKRTDADEIKYDFDHRHEPITTSQLSNLEKNVERINKIKGSYDESLQKINSRKTCPKTNCLICN